MTQEWLAEYERIYGRCLACGRVRFVKMSFYGSPDLCPGTDMPNCRETRLRNARPVAIQRIEDAGEEGGE